VSQLCFTSDEAAAFLNQVMNLSSPDNIAALEYRTEGWIVVLQMAAIPLQTVLATQSLLSMQGREDIHPFIQAFSGSHRYITDYLAEETLICQPEAAGFHIPLPTPA
jgi:LuxR family maltose regulon positive regulatory protein